LKRSWTTAAIAAVCIGAAVSITGCETIGYYAQALHGQAELWRSTRPIDVVAADPQSPPLLKQRLGLAKRIREFATNELALPDNGSYRGYADLQRPYVVWNVFAAEALSVSPRQWCFPVAGCVAYKGFFDKAQADALAADLRRKGLDVFVGGVPAYSTLGFLDDPILNTFIHYPSAELARLIFHELAHQVAYARDDTQFNESFAVAVELEGVQRWLRKHGTDAELATFQRARSRRVDFHAIAEKYRSKLAELYGSRLDKEQKTAGKAAIFSELADEYTAMKSSWGGFRGYDPWLGEDANNATLASIAVYSQQVPQFQALLAKSDGDMERFYAEVKVLARMQKSERNARLAALSGETSSRDPQAAQSR
jgi:predicted aminopeptidase